MIGVLDSNLGGLASVRAISDAFADRDIVYFADTARGPYSENSPGAIQSFASEGARFLIEQGARLLAIA